MTHVNDSAAQSGQHIEWRKPLSAEVRSRSLEATTKITRTHRHVEVIELTLVARRLLGETRVVEDISVIRQHADGTAVTTVLEDVTIAALWRHGGALPHVTRGTVLRDLDAIPSGRLSVRGGTDFPGGQEQQWHEPDDETGRHA